MSKKFVYVALLGLGLLSLPAFGVIGTIDDVPAATLLLPYFEVDLANAAGPTTLFSINNASAAPAIAHVTLWTNKSVPTLDFNVYLTGYDVVTFNVRDIFNGVLPQTDHIYNPATGHTDSPVGIFSLVTNPVTGVGPGSTSCDPLLPTGNVPQILQDFIREAHTGQPITLRGGLCAASDTGDVAVGYITIDNVSGCSVLTPQDGNLYFGTAVGPNNENQLWGDWFLVDPANAFAQGETLVHIEADPQLVVPTAYTFYARYSAQNGVQDNREGLGTTWASRFLGAPVFPDGTDLIVWRDAKQPVNPFGLPFTCLLTPAWEPLSQTQIVIFDEEENPEEIESFPFSPPIPGISRVPFPDETNRTTVGSSSFPVDVPFGWVYLNLNSNVANQVPVLDTVTTADYMQNFVTTVMSAGGLFSVGFDAVSLNNVTFDVGTLGGVTVPGRADICIGIGGVVSCV